MKRQEPFIGVTCDIHLPKKRRDRDHFELVCDSRYPEAIRRAGGYPILLPAAFRKHVIRRYLREIDGLVIVGGDDVDPRLYGEKRKPGTGTVFRSRLLFEIRLYRHARQRGIPILGICYGMQLINVMEGGTLFQDIRRDAGSRFNHRKKTDPHHRVRLDPSSRLGRIFGRKTLMAHSSHHQAVCRVAPGFRPVAFAPDGIVEALESSRGEKIMGVQWHPERTLDHPMTEKLFKAFVAACVRS